MGNHVFISYSRSDQHYVDKLASAFSKRGIEYWIDRHIDYGTRWTQTIRDKIDTCAAFVVVMTPKAEDSVWVGREIDQAELKGRPILPLLLRGHRFFRLAEHQYEDVQDGATPSKDWFIDVRALARSGLTQRRSKPARTIERPSRGFAIEPERFTFGRARPTRPTRPRRPPSEEVQSHLRLGQELGKSGRWQQALAEFDQAVRLQGTYAPAHNGRARALNRLGRPKDALKAYETAISLDPGNSASWGNKALVLTTRLRRHKEALVAAEQAIRLKPDVARWHNARGLALRMLSRIEDALAAYDRAIDLNPRFFPALTNRGYAHLERGDNEQALADFNRSNEINGAQALTHKGRGEALKALGREVEAGIAFSIAKTLSK